MKRLLQKKKNYKLYFPSYLQFGLAINEINAFANK